MALKKKVDNATDKIEDNIDEIKDEVTEDPSTLKKLEPYFEQIKDDLKDMQNTKEKKEKLQNSLLLSWKAISALSATPFVLKLLGIGPGTVVNQIETVSTWFGLGPEKIVDRSYEVTAFMEGFLVLAALMSIFKVYLYLSKVNAPSDKDLKEQAEILDLDDIDDMIFKAMNTVFE